jgi:hypothetical protein
MGTSKQFATYNLLKAKNYLTNHVKKELEPFMDTTVFEASSYPLDVTLVIYRKDNRLGDVDNRSIIAKWTTDTIVREGIIPEDNWKYIRSLTILDGGLDKENPRITYFMHKDGK